MRNIYEKLEEYSKSDYYGFHMPGHKRKMDDWKSPYDIDITEITDFDDLHHPEKNGILVNAQKRAAKLYQSEETHFLINGSTAGLLSAISASVRKKGKILIARNCHRSVYHGIELRDLEAIYIYPQREEKFGINGEIFVEDVENSIKKYRDIEAIVITSPTYDGICSDVKKICEVAHKNGVIVIVDQAHGAHFPFGRYFPNDAIKDGADLVIHSVHKTLPSLTQTALLHVNGNLVDRKKVCKFLSVYQTSSPSYVLMASIDKCMDFLEKEGKEKFEEYEINLKKFYEGCKKLENLKVVELDNSSKDISKILISTYGTNINGEELAKTLYNKYHLEMEMVTPSYVIALSSVMDEEKDFKRLEKSLLEIDKEIKKEKKSVDFEIKETRAIYKIGESEEKEKEILSLDQVKNRICGTYIYIYPPGIPILAPGELLTEEILEQIKLYKKYDIEIHGIEENEKIEVLK